MTAIDDKLNIIFEKIDDMELEDPKKYEELLRPEEIEACRTELAESIKAKMRQFEDIEENSKKLLESIQNNFDFEKEEADLERMKDVTRKNDEMLAEMRQN